MILAMIVYGSRDAASILMGRGHRVSLRWRGRDANRQRAWMLDGQLITLAALEDAAERYEKLRNRITERRPRPAR